MKTTKTSILVAREGSSKANQGETARINGSWQTRTEMGGNRSRRCSAAVMWRHSRSGSKRNRRPEAPVSHHHVDHIGSGRSRCLMGQAATKHSTEKVSRTSFAQSQRPGLPAIPSAPLPVFSLSTSINCSVPLGFKHHVCPFVGPLYHQAPMAPALPDATC